MRNYFRYVKHFILATMLFIVASPAFAVTVDLGGYTNGVFNPTQYNAWNIYAFGDASVIVNILQSISAMVGSSEYHSVLLFVAMLSFIGMAVVAAISGTMSGAGMKMLLMFIGFIFIIDVGFNDTVNLDVISALGFSNTTTSATGGPAQSYGSSEAVGNIPFIIGVPESIITTFGHELTKMIQQDFSLPSDLGVDDGGFNLANSLVNAETKLQITNPEFSETLSSFSENCVMPSIAGGWLSPNLLATSTDLFPPTGGSSSYGGVNPVLSTYVYNSENPQGVLVNCGPAIGATMSDTSVTSSSPGNAYEYIAWYLVNKVSISDFNPADLGIQSFSTTGATTWLSTVENNANAFLLNQGSSSSANNILQAAAINGMRPALRQAAALSGSSANMMGIAVAQGKQEMVSGWATAAAIFKEMSGYLYAVLQALVLAMGPLVIIAMFIPGTGLKLVGSYMQVAVWLALWQPLLSIVNYIVLLYSQAQSTAVMGGSTGFTMQNIPVVSEFTSRMMLAGSFMATLVPLFAWGMVKGGMAVTDLITRGLSNQIMSQAGNVAATGNVTLGNESMDDNTIDQNMLMPKYSVGYGLVNTIIDGDGINATASYGATNMTRGNSAVSVSQTITRAQQVAYDAKSSDAYSEAGQVQLQKAILAGGEIVSSSGSSTGQLFNTGKNAGYGGQGQVGANSGNPTTTENRTGFQNTNASTANTESGTSVGGGFGSTLMGIGVGTGVVGILGKGAGTAATTEGAAAVANETQALVGAIGSDGVLVPEDVDAIAGAAPAVGAVADGGASVLGRAVNGLRSLVANPKVAAGMIGGGMLLNNVKPSYTQNSGNMQTNQNVTGNGVTSNTSTGPTASYQHQAQVITQAMDVITGLINGGTIKSSKELSSLQKMYSHLSAAKKDFATSEAYKASEGTATTVTIARGTPWGDGLAAMSGGNPNITPELNAKKNMPSSPVPLSTIEKHLLPKVQSEVNTGNRLYTKATREVAPVNAATSVANQNATPLIGQHLGGPVPFSEVESLEGKRQAKAVELKDWYQTQQMLLGITPAASAQPFTPPTNGVNTKENVFERYFSPHANVGRFNGGAVD